MSALILYRVWYGLGISSDSHLHELAFFSRFNINILRNFFHEIKTNVYQNQIVIKVSFDTNSPLNAALFIREFLILFESVPLRLQFGRIAAELRDSCSFAFKIVVVFLLNLFVKAFCTHEARGFFI